MTPELKVTIDARVSVDKKTAEACLALIELYVNEHDVNIIGERSENGEVSFHFTNSRNGV